MDAQVNIYLGDYNTTNPTSPDTSFTIKSKTKRFLYRKVYHCLSQ